MRGKIIKGLQHCTTSLGCCGCPYSEGDKCTVECKLLIDRDALELLTEQAKPDKAPFREANRFEGSWYYVCGKCHVPIGPTDRFCRNCGIIIDWR